MSMLSTATSFAGMVLPAVPGQTPQPEAAAPATFATANTALGGLTRGTPHAIIFRDNDGNLWGAVGTITPTTPATVRGNNVLRNATLGITGHVTDRATFDRHITALAATLNINPADVQIFRGTGVQMQGLRGFNDQRAVFFGAARQPAQPGVPGSRETTILANSRSDNSGVLAIGNAPLPEE